jgi:hypothetical protein
LGRAEQQNDRKIADRLPGHAVLSGHVVDRRRGQIIAEGFMGSVQPLEQPVVVLGGAADGRDVPDVAAQHQLHITGDGRAPDGHDFDGRWLSPSQTFAEPLREQDGRVQFARCDPLPHVRCFMFAHLDLLQTGQVSGRIGRQARAVVHVDDADSKFGLFRAAVEQVRQTDGDGRHGDKQQPELDAPNRCPQPSPHDPDRIPHLTAPPSSA